ncbi:MAG TPA: hypothetical protein VOB72_14975 [Candidatus Dormibacteraeota bacterium]|nr:hypothetical protein [Candidatus Dormibacteraeota bacterium]
MASFRRRWIGAAAGVPVVGLMALLPTNVWAATQCDVSTNPISAAGCAVDHTIANAAGVVAQSAADSAVHAVTKWVVDTAVWLLDQLANVVLNSTSPVLSVDWFHAHYADMVAVAWVVAPIFLLLGIVQAILRSDLGLLGRILGQLVVVALLTTGAVALAQLLIGTVDQLSGFVARNSNADLHTFITGMGSTMSSAVAVGSTTGPPGGLPLFFAFLAGVLTVIGSALIWLELLARTLVIYAALLFFPVLLAAALWPRASGMVQLLAEVLVAVIVSKFIIVAIVALGVAALSATGSHSAADQNAGPSLLVGAGMLLVAAWAPWKFYRLMPTMEAAMTHQVGHSFHQGLTSARWRGQQAAQRVRQTRRLPLAGARSAPAKLGTAGVAAATVATAGLAAATNVVTNFGARVANGGNGPTAPRQGGTGVRPPWQSMGVARDANSFFRLLRVSRPSGGSNGVAKDANSYFQLLGVRPKQLPGGGTNG